MNMVRNTVALAAAYTLVMTLPNVLPIFVVVLMNDLALAEEQAGRLLTAELVMLAATPVLLSPLAPRVSVRAVLLMGSSAALLAHLLSIATQDPDVLLALRMFAGFSVGLIFLGVGRVSALMPDPVRLYGILNSTGVLVAILLFMISPRIIEVHGLAGAYGMLVAITATAVPLVALFRWSDRPVSKTRQPLPATARQLVLLVAGLTLAVGPYMAMYSFSEPIAIGVGLTSRRFVLFLAVVQGLCLLATASASWCGLRFGMVRPLLFSLCGCALFGVIALNTTVIWIFLSAFLLTNMCFLFSVSYQLGVGAVLDESGRVASLAGGVFYMGAAVSPFLGGFLITRFGYSSLAFALICGCVLGFIAFARVLYGVR